MHLNMTNVVEEIDFLIARGHNKGRISFNVEMFPHTDTPVSRTLITSRRTASNFERRTVLQAREQKFEEIRPDRLVVRARQHVQKSFS